MFGLLRNQLQAIGRVNWALSDQAMISASNFLTSVIAARMMGIEEFGRFMVAWMIILLFKDLQSSRLEPTLLSIGPKQSAKDRAEYFGSAVAEQAAFAGASFILVVIGMLIAAPFVQELNLAELTLPLAAAVFADEMQDFMRRYFYTVNRPVSAFVNDFISYGGRIVVLAFLWWYAPVTSAGTLWVLFALGIIPVVIGLFTLDPVRINLSRMIPVAVRHWELSKWTVGTSILRWMAGNLFIFMGGAILGAQTIGAVRAAMNVLAPRNVVINGLTNIVIVNGSTTLHEKGPGELRRYLMRIGAFGLAFEASISIFAIIFAEPIMYYVYGPDFVPYAFLIYWLAAVNLVQFLVFPFGCGLKILEYTKPYFVSAIFEAAFGLLASYFLVTWFGLHGVTIGLVITFAIALTVLSRACLKRLNEYVPAATSSR